MVNYRENAVIFDCQGEQLVSVISQPTESVDTPQHALNTGVVIIVGGPQYRAGSHRQFVLLARALAAAGTPVLRFDYRGMGDSTGDLHTFENVNEDIAAAIGALRSAVPSVKNVVLWGLCDGASAALLYCHATQDPRVHGLCLLNPWVRSEASQAKTQVKHYYNQRLRQKEFWIKLLSGKVAIGAIQGLLGNIKTAFGKSPDNSTTTVDTFQTQMAKAWKRFDGPMLLILSGQDYTAKEFLEYSNSNSSWCGALTKPNMVLKDMPNADHTFSGFAAMKDAEENILEWIQNLKGSVIEK